MSYLVLARKSRPQTFNQVVGQRPVVKTLQNSLIRNRVAHAILFSGVRGVGKTTLARIMAKAINCQTEDLADRPCDQCASCKEIASGAAFDLLEIDGASNRGIQEIRELKEKIRYLPTTAKYKIIIIDEVHMLTTEAFNALLKTLEEPPAHVHFMFATTEIHKIPITILSRCQQYELKRISADELHDHFAKLTENEGFEIDSGALSLIVREAAGSVRDGLSLLEQMFSFCDTKVTTQDVVEVLGLVDREVLMNLTQGLIEGSRTSVLNALEEIFKYGMDIKRFMEDLMGYFRTLILCKISDCNHLIDLPEEELADFQKLAASYSNETLQLKLSLLMSAAETLRFATQPRLTLEISFLKIIDSGNVASVTSLLAQLDSVISAMPAAPDPQSTPNLQHAEAAPVKKKDNSLETAPTFIPPAPEPPSTEPNAKVVPESSTPAALQVDQTSNPSVARVQGEPGTEVSSTDDEVDQGATPDETPHIEVHPHEKDVRRHWPDFIHYVKDRKIWMAQALERADSVKQEVEGELHLTYTDPNICALIREKHNHQLITEFTLDFFQKPLKVRFILPSAEDLTDANGDESPQQKRMQLSNDPLVMMAAEVFNGQVGDIRIGPRSR